VYDVCVADQDDTALADPAERAALLRFVERFAMALADAGMQRMPARVFAFALADDAERHTAAELASALRVSPAAISGAVRYLVQNRLLGREREPGERVDTYRVYDDNLWYTIMTQRDQLVEPFLRLTAEGAELLGQDNPGGRRMRETYEFFRFLHRKMADLMDEWQEYKTRVLDS
jgi:DNA-binding transcriptional regulator GbsR (MarR family)